jgi:hypothetical protein
MYSQKYLKYKYKYLALKKIFIGAGIGFSKLITDKKEIKRTYIDDIILEGYKTNTLN